MEAILNTQRRTPQRLEALQKFCTKHASAQAFTDTKNSTKKELVEELAAIVKESSTIATVDPQELSMTLRTLRLLSREDISMEALHNLEAISWTMIIGGLLTSPTSSTPLHTDAAVIEESLKCLVNIIVKGQHLINEFGRLDGHKACFKMLKLILAELMDFNGITSQTLDSDLNGKVLTDGHGKFDPLLVPVCRLLFSVTRPVDDALITSIITALRNDLLLDCIADFMFIYSHASQHDESIASRLCVTDMLRTVTNLTLDLGALGSSDIAALTVAIPRFPRLVLSMLRFWQLPSSQPRDAIYNLHLTVASCMVNIPVPYAPSVLLKESGEYYDGKELNERMESVVKITSAILSAQIQESPKSTTPMLMWMSNFVTGFSKIRPLYLKHLFPNRNLLEEAPSNGGIAPPHFEAPTIGNQIIRLMTSLDIAVKHCSNEFLFVLVDEDTDLFVKLTGFGNAAGLLVNRNLFGMGKFANASTTREDLEALKLGSAAPSTSSSGIPPLPAAAGSAKNTSSNDENEDEKEEQARQLMEKLESMERRGLVKIVRKGDQPPDDQQTKD